MSPACGALNLSVRRLGQQVRSPRDFQDRPPWLREWLVENTWCDSCNAADLGLDSPREYAEDGRIFVEGLCRKCGSTVRSEISERVQEGSR